MNNLLVFELRRLYGSLFFCVYRLKGKIIGENQDFYHATPTRNREDGFYVMDVSSQPNINSELGNTAGHSGYLKK